MEQRYKTEYTNNSFNGMTLNRYILNDGYKLFKVKASYAKKLIHPSYYVVSKNQKQAKEIFKNSFSWLTDIESVEECSAEETEMVVNNPLTYGVI